MTKAPDNKHGNKSVNELIVIVTQPYEGNNQGNADSAVDLQVALDRMVRKAFLKEVAFGRRSREKSMNMQSESESSSVMSHSFRPFGLYSPWNSPGQNTGVGNPSLLQRNWQTVVHGVAKSWTQLGDFHSNLSFLI